MAERRRTHTGLLAAAMLVAACGVDPIAAEGPEEPAPPSAAPLAPPAVRVPPEPQPIAPREESPPPRESPAPAPEPDPAPEPSPAPAEPATPTSPPPDDSVEVAIIVSSFGAFGDTRRRSFSGSSNLPAGAILAYEVLPARYDGGTGLWQADEGSGQARRGLLETRPTGSPRQTTWGLMTLDFEVEIDITGFPCAPPEPHDVLDVEACPLAVRIWFATVLDGPWGQVHQPEAVRAVVGERGERMIAPHCVGCSTLGARDRQRVEYTWPRVDSGAQTIASTRFLSMPLNPERFR